MMNLFYVKRSIRVLTLALIASFASAQALSAPYVGSALGTAKIDSDEMTGDAKNTTLILIFGHQFDDNFALEARLR